MRPTRPRRFVLVVTAAAALAMPSASGAPPTAASDTADVHWQGAPAASDLISCGADGESVGCDVTETTITSPFPCESEVVQAASTNPVVLYPDTFCTASVFGRLVGATEKGTCDITGLNGLQVSFSSGINAVFDGRFFPIGAVFTPTGTSGTSVTSGVLKVIDAAPLDTTLVGTGQISAVFSVVFTTPLSSDCRSGKGFLSPLAKSTVQIRN
jgi:hypothetical protein